MKNIGIGLKKLIGQALVFQVSLPGLPKHETFYYVKVSQRLR